MIKKYLNIAFVYAIVALVFGVFYREFTKILAFEGETALSVIHTHYFVLGMFFFLILALFEKNFSVSNEKGFGKFVLVYNIGLNITGAAFLVRGVAQIVVPTLSSGLNASISGIAGIGHILLAIGLLTMLWKIEKIGNA